MIELLAIAPDDGWAFVRRGRQIQVVRPPYQRWNLAIVPESTLEAAIQHHGFAAEEKTFPDWRSLIVHLKDQIVQTRQAQGRGAPDSEAIRNLVHRAPPKILGSYLDRIESELLPNRELEAALDILTRLLEVEAVKTNQDLYRRALHLLSRCRSIGETDERTQLVDEKTAWAKQYPRASHRYGADNLLALCQTVWQRGQILAFPA